MRTALSVSVEAVEDSNSQSPAEHLTHSFPTPTQAFEIKLAYECQSKSPKRLLAENPTIH